MFKNLIPEPGIEPAHISVKKLEVILLLVSIDSILCEDLLFEREPC